MGAAAPPYNPRPADWPSPPAPASARMNCVRPIGAGGMGEVYKARDSRLDRTVAIKVLPSEVAGDPDLRSRFEREARAVAALDHPHICGIYDVGSVDGTHYLVMPHLEGQTLAARLEKGPLPLDQALKIASRLPTRSTKRIGRASSIAISSPPTSC